MSCLKISSYIFHYHILNTSIYTHTTVNRSMVMKSTAFLVLSVWLVVSMIVTTTASHQPAVLDTDGQPLQSGVEYYILPAVTDVSGGVTLFEGKNNCPLLVGQEPLGPEFSLGLPVTLEPFAEGETIIREDRDLTVTFQVFSICIQSTIWRVGEENPKTRRRPVVIAGERDYFRIQKNETGIYDIVWCPTEVCPICRFRCGSAGIVVENGNRLLALDGPAFPFQFTRVSNSAV
ncbi:kunitz type trypsin inhibitor 111-like [Mercurialis annua]|uniref:kunitz type trypsin inhibitor 111-like n=1 Tax=Mercurialis annua TaxID=3986 RepID=UPI00215E1D32|nr:kunitz type trypsin inhibitor 111-like [Mercurialis annua]